MTQPYPKGLLAAWALGALDFHAIVDPYFGLP
jgi:hypothetical protein